jgi:FkbM family methyltransferase
MELDGQPPFGALRLPTSVETIRNLANRMHANAVSRRLMSLARRGCLVGRDDPIDVEVFGNCRARLYPRSNRCEKRVFLGVHSWDAAEREAISAQMQKSPASRPFVFVDGGANVGLYSLYVASESRRLKRDVRIIAIEPDPVNLRRLRFNIAASQAHEISVAPFALGNREDTGRLLSVQSNRGEVRLARAEEEKVEGTVDVPIRPLHDILVEAGVEHADVLKLDIEGAEYPTLQALFAEAARDLWPGMIILEVGRGGKPTEAFRLCAEAGYVQLQRTGINALLIRQDMNNPINSLTMDK